MTLSTAPPAFFGWRAVWAAFVLAIFGSGVGFYGPPVYLHTVIERTGWPLALVSIAVTVHFSVGALAVASLPRAYKRFGVATITDAGAAGLALGVLGWAVAMEPWQLFAAAVLSGAGWAAMGAAAVHTLVAPWFIRARPAALSMAYNGIAIGGIIFFPLWVALINAIDFVAAATLVGIVMIFVVAALSRSVFYKTPEQLGQAPDGDAPNVIARRITSVRARPLCGSALWTNRAFLTLASGMALGLFAQIGLLSHLFSLLVPRLGAQGAGLTMSLAPACAIAGRMIAVWVMPVNADRRLVSCTSYAVQIVGSILLIAAAGRHIPLLLLGVVLFGLGIGNAMSLPPLIAQVEFVKEDVQRVVALIIAVGQATYAFAPVPFGILRWPGPSVLRFFDEDTTACFVAAALIQLAAIGCLLAGRRRA